jgi:hypothetical protein
MWFLILVLLLVAALVAVGVVTDVRAKRRRKAYGDWDFAGRVRSGPDPELRQTNEADLNIRSNGRMRELRDPPGNGGMFG